jgi:hypothetical protein
MAKLLGGPATTRVSQEAPQIQQASALSLLFRPREQGF